MEAWRSFAGQVDAFLGENYAGMDWRLFESEWRANASLTAAAGGRSMGTPESLDWRSLPFSHPTAPLCGVVLYFTGIALLKRYMRDREPIKLPTAVRGRVRAAVAAPRRASHCKRVFVLT